MKPRIDGGRALEPRGDCIIHGAGQDPRTFVDYSNRLAPQRPVVYMAYKGLKGMKAGFLVEDWTSSHPDRNDCFLVPQIGLSMTKDGSPKKHYEQDVAAGRHDKSIRVLCEELRRYDRPAYVRIGYEFNGGWNGYVAESYVAAYRRIVTAFRDAGLDQVATVWCAEAGAATPEGTEWMDYYPGDDFVDWWGIDLFSVEHFTKPNAVAMMDEAAKRGFPVMIGESTPRYVGVLEGQKSWDAWYRLYFDFMAEHAAVKAFSYINWDWSRYAMWQNWGDGRVEMNDVVLDRWRKAIAGPMIAHGRDEAGTRRLLRCE